MDIVAKHGNKIVEHGVISAFDAYKLGALVGAETDCGVVGCSCTECRCVQVSSKRFRRLVAAGIVSVV